jgi:hypothetical protein
MRLTIALLIPTACLLFSCNKLDNHPDLVGEWGTSVELENGHTLLISDDATGHPYENPCNGSGTLKVKLKDNQLEFKKNGSTRIRYTISTYPIVATEALVFDAQTGCIPVTTVQDTIFPGETYMILNESIYVKKRF